MERYGAKKLPEDHAVVDWGVTWNEIEPYYTRADKLLGVSGKAGNIRGKLIEGGNPFEGPRSEEYPTPPMKLPYVSSLFEDAAKSLGYHPYPNPAATLSVPYTNPDGVSRPGCAYCGFCDRFGCMIGAKAQPTNTLLPLVREAEERLAAQRLLGAPHRVRQNARRRATGVQYIDASGEEMLPARRRGFPGLLDAQQHAPAAALRHRRALRSGHGQRRRWGATSRIR